ncbi:MAG: carbohydrate-binding family 9-like protein [Pirellulales bacterium]|nr:carbohydrate-binding family 9-like protein [Pirellulales bacterium]
MIGRALADLGIISLCGLMLLGGVVPSRGEPADPAGAATPAEAAIPYEVAVPPLPKDFPPPREYVCPKTAAPPRIDGALDDSAWEQAPWSEDFVDIEGPAKPAPTHRTRMKMLWDDHALYIAAEITEPNVWGTITEHDAVIFQDPDFEVFLDPDGDRLLYGELELNPLNTTWDLLLPKPYNDGGQAINGWEIIGLRTATRVQGTLNDPRDRDTGWTVEIAWPWKGIKELTKQPLPPRPGDSQRINFSRVNWDVQTVEGKVVKIPQRPEHNWVWSPQGLINMHVPERWGRVKFAPASK